MFKKEGEACGGHRGGHEGFCASGLKCYRDPNVFDEPGRCVLEGRLYPELLLNNACYYKTISMFV